MALLSKRLWMGLGVTAVSLVAFLKAMGLSGEAPARPESVTSLPGCPASPNCVGSGPGEDAVHAIAPLSFSGDPAAALDRLKAVMAAEGGRLVREDGRYLHFEFSSRFLRFVDDVECLLDAEHRRIDVRSASRSGHSDLGVNRRRIERLRVRFHQAPS